MVGFTIVVYAPGGSYMRTRTSASALLFIVGLLPVVAFGLTAEEAIKASGVRGGLVVHAECGDGTLAAELAAKRSYLVHALDMKAENVAAARKRFAGLEDASRVSADHWNGKELPYADGVVNLLVVSRLRQGSGGQAGVGFRVSAPEVGRVLAPRGVGMVEGQMDLSDQTDRTDLTDRSQEAGLPGWRVFRKAVPPEIDEWTHYLHDPGNNAVSRDTVVGPPRRMQWVGAPRYGRHHDHMSSISAVVVSNGRIFYIADMGSTASILLPSRWFVIARDASSGVLLWTREMGKWHTRMWRLKSGPAQLPRRLVAVGDTVYVTLSFNAPVKALDAITGRDIKTYKGTEKTEELIVSGDTMFVMINPGLRGGSGDPSVSRYWDEKPRVVKAVNLESGEILWQKQYATIMPLTLGVDEKRAYLHDGTKVVCLDRETGKDVWSSEPIVRRQKMASQFAPTLVIHKDVVLFSGMTEKPDSKDSGGGDNTMHALSAKDGKKLWEAPHPRSGYKSPEDLFVAGGLVWCGATISGGVDGTHTGRDLMTGKVKKEFKPDIKTYWFHHRCHRGKATDKYLMMSRTGIEFLDLEKQNWEIHHWVRGACLYGVVPCNGLVYAPPHPCACYLETKLSGFCALAPAAKSAAAKPAAADRLGKGPAFGKVHGAGSMEHGDGKDWATYRGDMARSGSTKTTISARVKQAWSVDLGGELTPPVIADGKVFVSRKDTHTVHVLSAADGKDVWAFTAGAMVDSPPTIAGPLCIFGSTDGHVYCLRASDGQPVWRFRAAPIDRRHVFYDRVESVWPVHGSVLVHDGVLWCIAGRSMFTDGGLRLYRMNPATGEVLFEKVMDETDPGDPKKMVQDYISWLNMPVGLPDILTTDGKLVYLKSQAFKPDGNRLPLKSIPGSTRGPGKAEQNPKQTHLFTPTGFLDDTYWHRTYWVYGSRFTSGWCAYYLAGKATPSGKILAFDNGTVYGFGREPQYYRWTTTMEFQLFAAAAPGTEPPKKQPAAAVARPAAAKPAAAKPPAKKGGKKKKRRPKKPSTSVKYIWTQKIPVLARAMVLSPDVLFVAGPRDVVDENASKKNVFTGQTAKKLAEQEAALAGRSGAVLWAASRKDGSKLAALDLASPPVFDGLAAADGKLFLVSMDGKVTALEGFDE